MIYKILDADSIKAMFIKSFNLKINKHANIYDLDLLYDAFLEIGITQKYEPIPNWNAYEDGEFENAISDDDFIELLLKNTKSDNGYLYVSTHDSLCYNEIFKIDQLSFEIFVKITHLKLYKTYFFNTFDIMLFKPSEKYLSILHHSGYWSFLSLD